jgi:hypothetical protein
MLSTVVVDASLLTLVAGETGRGIRPVDKVLTAYMKLYVVASLSPHGVILGLSRRTTTSAGTKIASRLGLVDLPPLFLSSLAALADSSRIHIPKRHMHLQP